MTFDLPQPDSVRDRLLRRVPPSPSSWPSARSSRFFAQNRTARVRRHESVVQYYGHLVLGH